MEKRTLVLCDTDVLIEFYKGNKEIVDTLRKLGQDNLYVSVISCAEMIYGALNKKEQSRIRKDFSSLNLLPVTEPVSWKFYDLMVKYSLSHNLAIPDAIIAATALENEVKLYTLNKKDFKYIEGLELYAP